MSNEKINNGGPAFPVTLDHRGCVGAYGMNLRDWFAGQALAGMQTQWKHIELYLTSHGSGTAKDVREFMAWASYEQADAMIEARNS